MLLVYSTASSSSNSSVSWCFFVEFRVKCLEHFFFVGVYRAHPSLRDAAFGVLSDLQKKESMSMWAILRKKKNREHAGNPIKKKVAKAASIYIAIHRSRAKYWNHKKEDPKPTSGWPTMDIYGFFFVVVLLLATCKLSMAERVQVTISQ
jgi:hypothetical protein